MSDPNISTTIERADSASSVRGPNGKWPKLRRELTPQQQETIHAWYKKWLPVLNTRLGAIGHFNHGFPLKTANPALRTLEIGVGQGQHARMERSDNYYGVDLVPGFMEYRVRMVAANAEVGLPFKSASFDRVLAIHVLEHLADLPRALDEVIRILRPGGLFSVVIPCEGGLGYSLGRKLTVQRMFEKEFKQDYDWMISYEHINTAREVLGELQMRFQVLRKNYFPLRLPIVDLNVCIGLDLSRPA